jgi:hypothetical protein
MSAPTPVRWSALPALFLLLVLAYGLRPAAAEDSPPGRKPAGWQVVRTERLAGVSVSLSRPVLVARSESYLWFPTVMRLAGGDLLAMLNNYSDEVVRTPTAHVCWSGDGGLTWSAPKEALYGDSNLALKNGDHLILPYTLLRRPGDALGAPYQICPKGKRELRTIEEGVRVTGWPRPDLPFSDKLKKAGIAGFFFNGGTLTLKDGTYLATLYGYFEGPRRCSLVLAESKDGIQWRIRATVADEKCKLAGADGPSESALCRLKDGRLMCVFRLATLAPYGQTFSGDDGKTWTEAVAMKDVSSVQPCLAVLPDGVVVLSGGRPGNSVWVNLAGDGKGWQRVELHGHHDACHPGDPIAGGKHTSGYSRVVPLDAKSALVIYDRIKHAWTPEAWVPAPKDAPGTYSVWVVRLTFDLPAP